MQPRIKNPAEVLPDAMTALQALAPVAYKGGVPPHTLALVHLRARVNVATRQPAGATW